MLTAIRSKASSIIVKVLFGFLILSFAIWGIGDIFRGGGRANPAIEVGDVAIGPQALTQEFNNYLRNFNGLNAEQAKQMGLGQVVVQGLIDRALVDVEARRLGTAVSADYAREVILNDPRFYNQQGQFERDRFSGMLFQIGMSEGQYVQQLQTSVAQRQLLSPLEAGAAAPASLLQDIHAYRGETRVAKTLLLPPAVIPDPAEPDEAAIKAYYDEHQNEFLAPEYRSLVLVMTSPAEVAKSLTIADEQLQQAYDARKDQLALPDTRRVEQIVVPDEAAAKTVVERAKAEPFATASTGIEGAVYTDLGTVGRTGLVPELAEPAFAAAEDAVVGPIESKLGEQTLGWYVLKVGKTEPGRPRTFDEAKEELRQELLKNEAAAEVVARANRLDDAMAGGASLEDAAARVGATVQKIAAVDASGKAPDGSPVAPLAGNPVLLQMAFDTAAGESSPQRDLPDGGLAALRVESVQAAAPRPLDEVRPQVIEGWKAAERAKALAAKAESLAEAARGGRTLEDIATELSLTVKTSAPFNRYAGDEASGVDRGLAAKLFAAKANEVVTAESPGGQVLAQLTEVRKAEPLGDQERKSLQDELRRDIAGDVQRQFVGALRQEIEVTTDQAVIDQAF